MANVTAQPRRRIVHGSYGPRLAEAAAVGWAAFIGFDFIADAFEDVKILELQQSVWHGEGFFRFLELQLPSQFLSFGFERLVEIGSSL